MRFAFNYHHCHYGHHHSRDLCCSRHQSFHYINCNQRRKCVDQWAINLHQTNYIIGTHIECENYEKWIRHVNWAFCVQQIFVRHHMCLANNQYCQRIFMRCVCVYVLGMMCSSYCHLQLGVGHVQPYKSFQLICLSLSKLRGMFICNIYELLAEASEEVKENYYSALFFSHVG